MPRHASQIRFAAQLNQPQVTQPLPHAFPKAANSA